MNSLQDTRHPCSGPVRHPYVIGILGKWPETAWLAPISIPLMLMSSPRLRLCLDSPSGPSPPNPSKVPGGIFTRPANAGVSNVHPPDAGKRAELATGGSAGRCPQLTCQHVDPQVPLPHGAHAQYEMKVLIFKGTLQDALRKVSAQSSELK
jgi:hypothetical protein